MLENINPTSGRDKRPPADLLGAAEDALDARALAALAKAWGMAKDRQPVAGSYITREGAAALAAELAEPISDGQAADVIAELNDSAAVDIALEDEALDKIWDMIA